MTNLEERNLFERIPAPLLSWYEANKRDLPWRKNPTPYEVWVSEIMLQQTRVEAVREYYTRFIAALPSVEALASCEEEKLLKLWEGLGYYSRVRNMQKAAKTIVIEYGGKFPEEIETLKTLAGIGSYTAGAIASIAFGKATAAVDGNVFRVIARLTENSTVISDLKYRKYLETELSKIYPKGRESQFTQSLFELGALVCKPLSPACERCPLAKLCKANENGSQRLFPVLPVKKAKREQDVFVFLIETKEGFCIRRRESGVLKGMNEFPSHVSYGESEKEVLNGWGVYAFTEKKRQKFTHIFTHIKWNITCVWVEADGAPFDTYHLEEIEADISLPTAFKQCLKMIEKDKIGE